MQAADWRCAFSSSGSGEAHWYPILTGNQQWKPGQFIVFYVLTKKYYPVNPQVSAGFTFNFAPGRVAIPGPSGIFLRLPYKPATFAKTLDWIVAYGPGAQGGRVPNWACLTRQSGNSHRRIQCCAPANRVGRGV